MSFYPLQAQNFSLSGSGCSVGDVVLNLKSFKDINGTNIAMTDLGSTAYLTIEPGNGTQEEQVSFTGVTQNSDGSAQLTGIKTVLFKTPYTETSGFAITHPGSVTAVLSNTAGFYNQFGILSDNSVITGYWQAPDPVAAQGVATQNYVLSTITTGGTLKVNAIVVAATAGETVALGNVVYLNSDGKWYLAKANAASKVLGVQLGIAQGAGSAAVAITGGVLVNGLDINQSGLVTGSTYYTSDTGTVSATAGTIPRVLGVAKSSQSLYFDPFSTLLPANISTRTASENITKNNAVSLLGTASYSASLASSSSQYFSRSNNSFNLTTGSITFWMKPSATSSPATIIANRNNSGLQGYNVSFSGGALAFVLGAGTTYATSATVFQTNIWYHVAVCWDTTEARFYVNGNFDARGSVGQTIATGSANLFLGAETNGGPANYYSGLLDSVRIWNIKLSQAQVQAYMNYELGVVTGIKASWNLNNVLTDDSGNAETLTNNGSVTFSTDTPSNLIPYTATSGSSTVYNSNASSVPLSIPFLGFALGTVTSGSTVHVQTGGVVSGFTNLVTGTEYFLAPTPGSIQNFPNERVRKVGIALSPTELLITNIF